MIFAKQANHNRLQRNGGRGWPKMTTKTIGGTNTEACSHFGELVGRPAGDLGHTQGRELRLQLLQLAAQKIGISAKARDHQKVKKARDKTDTSAHTGAASRRPAAHAPSQASPPSTWPAAHTP